NANVKIIGSHHGFSNSGDGPTAQCFEDIALMRVLPNMTVISPADGYQTKKAIFSMAEKRGPCFLRLHRNPTPLLTDKDADFTIGKADILKTGKDLTVIGTGPILAEVFLAQQKIGKDMDLEIINCHTVKPFDEETIIKSVKKTGGAVVVEEHQVFGGLGSAVAEVLAQNFPAPLEFIAVKDRFGASARTERELLENYGLTSDFIIQAIIKIKKQPRPSPCLPVRLVRRSFNEGGS
ncbi:MAG: transketolase C-terminal domain-containing protein, partial [bacterium]|nr:transketolase C-terminal domain-containing protein [bacterium]